MNSPSRRFPPPWSIEDNGAAFVVKDGAGQKLGYGSQYNLPSLHIEQ
jgi:hypothetical protein